MIFFIQSSFANTLEKKDLVYQESQVISSLYPEPFVEIKSPAFISREIKLTSQSEMEAWIQQLNNRSDKLRIITIGKSQENRDIFMLVFSTSAQQQADKIKTNGKPTILIIAQQHGDEPAGGEAALAYAEQLVSDKDSKLLEKVNILIIPRANPDGADKNQRDLANGFNLNRDHLLLTTPEGQALAQVFSSYQPQVVLDCHEFSVAGRWVQKFAGVQWPDAGIQYSTIPNQPEKLVQFSEKPFRQNLLNAFDKYKLKHDWYYTTSATNMQDKTVSMGGIGPDIGRNVSGLRNAVSFLLETRGVGLGNTNFRRRVFTHLVAIDSIIKTTAENAEEVIATYHGLRKSVTEQAGKGDIIVKGKATLERRAFRLVDIITGKVKAIEVDWRNSLNIESTLTRARPYAYLLMPTEQLAVEKLKKLDIDVYKVAKDAQIDVLQYKITTIKGEVKNDVTGRVGATNNNIISLETSLGKNVLAIQKGYFYIPLNQPNANLVIAALEPESQSSFIANHILSLPPESEHRILPVYQLMEPLAAEPELF